MTAYRDKVDRALEGLLDLHVEGEGATREALLRDPDLREEFQSLQHVADLLTELGDTLARNAGTVQIQDDVRDAIAHQALEQLAVVSASPYHDLEDAFREAKEDFDAGAGEVNLVADIMAAVAAGHLSEEDIERPHAEITGDFIELGGAIHAAAPEVELVEPVMESVCHSSVSRSNIVPLRARPTTARMVTVPAQKPKWPAYLGWAAAVAVCAGAGWMYVANEPAGRTNVPNLAEKVPEVSVEHTRQVLLRPEPDSFEVAQTTPSDRDPASTAPVVDAEDTTEQRVADATTEALTLQEVINARRRDLVQSSQQITGLASLTEVEAAQMLEEMNLSLEALIGATQFLSPEEAVAVLRAAIAQHPDDPNLLYALARNLDANPQYAGERMDQLNRMAAVDPLNALPHYMMASDHFARGDMALGLDALTTGSSYSEASAYALESAQQREAALIASGMSRDVARYLAITTAGEQEYADVASLRNELLNYGAHYEQLGEYGTAQQIYNAMNQLGVQLAEGADMAVEQQYGYETQEQAQLALLTIQGIAEIFQQPETVAMLGQNLGMLATGIAEVTEHIVARQEMVEAAGLSNPADASGLLNYLMSNGDLDLAGYSRR